MSGVLMSGVWEVLDMRQRMVQWIVAQAAQCKRVLLDGNSFGAWDKSGIIGNR